MPNRSDKARKNHRLYFLKSGQRFGDGPRGIGYRIADLNVGDGFDRRGQKSDLARAEFVDGRRTRTVNADRLDEIFAAGVEKLDLRALFDRSVNNAKQDDHAAIRVVPAVKYQRFKRRVSDRPSAAECLR